MSILNIIGYSFLSALGLVLLYVMSRVVFYAIFKSFFDAKQHSNKKEEEDENH
uniref:Uncharacterized protein n=1 Tax=viral metagenome TaxID=1070528 RepID=A0A6M3KVS6_9ZZZZ